MIDWDIVQGEINGSLSEMRKRQYEIPDAILTMKPLFADSINGHRINSYENFEKILKTMQDSKIPRSKLKKLREVYKDGRKNTEIYMMVNGMELEEKYLDNKIDFAGDFKCRYGFYEEEGRAVSAYFDAIEIMDFIK